MTPLAKIRESRGLTKAHVAKEVGCDKGHYWNIEAGKQVPSAALARKIARFFGNAVTEHQILYPEDYIDTAA